MSKKRKKQGKRMETSLSEHKRFKKTLKPPLSQINLTPSSWINDRLPDILWAVLAIDYWPRDKALSFFRHIAKYVQNNQDCYDVTITGINNYAEEKRRSFIRHMTSWSRDAKDMLRPIMLFENMPGLSDWKMYLEDPVPEKDWGRLSNAVLKTLWHQSEEATDCRWIKLLCEIYGMKIYFRPEMKETVQGIIEYPNYGDLAHIRPTIRAMEISPFTKKIESELIWPRDFWKTCYEKTGCSPEKSKNDGNLRPKDWDNQRKHYIEETSRLRRSIIEHFLDTSSNSATDARHEACIGFSLYAFTLFTEIIFYKLDYSLAGRMILRSLVECLITFKYLLDKNNEDLWKSYRAYGSGQAKLIYLKLQELENKPNSVDIDVMKRISNEDMWLELVPINLGHWDNADLRKMSDEAGLKEIYDQFYNWTSGFIHGNWSAIRESVYERCFNPLHRLHRLPTGEFPFGSSITLDALIVTNMIYELLAKAYPPFDDRIKKYIKLGE
jgi:hypothetical protein